MLTSFHVKSPHRIFRKTPLLNYSYRSMFTLLRRVLSQDLPYASRFLNSSTIPADLENSLPIMTSSSLDKKLQEMVREKNMDVNSFENLSYQDLLNKPELLQEGQVAVVKWDYNNSGRKFLVLLDIDTNHLNLLTKMNGEIVSLGHLTSKPFAESIPLEKLPCRPEKSQNLVAAKSLKRAPNPQEIGEADNKSSDHTSPRIGAKILADMSKQFSESISNQRKVIDSLTQIAAADSERKFWGAPEERRSRFYPLEEESEEK